MSVNPALTTLHRIREQEIELRSRELIRVRQQISWVNEQIVRLVGYQYEYHQMTNSTFSLVPHVYLDRQLFLSRLDENIHLLGKNLKTLEDQERVANNALQDLAMKAESLGSAINNLATTELKARMITNESQCDEQSRMMSASRRRGSLFE